MNAKKISRFAFAVLLLAAGTVRADSAADRVAEGNRLYREGRYDKAAEQYDRAIEADPELTEAQFNKANALYRQQKLDEAIEIYRQAAVQSRDADMVARAKYNLGNSYFRKGLEQKDDPRKAIESLEAGIDSWRQVRRMKPDNAAAARNIEVARLLIKQLREQMQNQSEQQESQDRQNQPEDPNSPQDSSRTPPPADDSKDAPEKDQEKNQPSEQQQDTQEAQDQPSAQTDEQQEIQAAEATADEILEKEEKDREQRRILIRGQQKVEKDW